MLAATRESLCAAMMAHHSQQINKYLKKKCIHEQGLEAECVVTNGPGVWALCILQRSVAESKQ